MGRHKKVDNGYFVCLNLSNGWSKTFSYYVFTKDKEVARKEAMKRLKASDFWKKQKDKRKVRIEVVSIIKA